MNGLLRRKISLIKYIHYLKRLRNRRLMLGFLASSRHDSFLWKLPLGHWKTARTIRERHDRSRQILWAGSFTPKSSQLSPIQCLWEECFIKNDNMRFVRIQKNVRCQIKKYISIGPVQRLIKLLYPYDVGTSETLTLFGT